MTMEYIHLSVIIPAYNEAKRITSTLVSIDAYLKAQDYTYEIIVVDDGSTDKTIPVVGALLTTIENLYVISKIKNAGKGDAVKSGMMVARGEYQLFMDADNSVKIDTVESFFKIMERGHDVVIGSIELDRAQVTEHNHAYRRVLGSLAKSLIRNIVTPGIYDTQRGFKLFTRHASHVIFPRQTIPRFGFDIELIVIALAYDLSIREVPVEWDNPEGSKVSLIDYPRTFVELFGTLANKYSGKYRSKSRQRNILTTDERRRYAP